MYKYINKIYILIMLIKPRINLEKINLFPKVLNCSIIKNQLVIII
jgi:hypothetical protein